MDKFIPQKDLRRNLVYEYTLDGEFINEYNSVPESSKQTSCNKTSIAKVLEVLFGGIRSNLKRKVV